jgi:hypothetical protein
MVQGIADYFRDQRLARHARELLLESCLELKHERFASLLTYGAAHIGSLPPDRLLNEVELRDASNAPLAIGALLSLAM